MKRKNTQRRVETYNNYVPLFVDLYQQQAVVRLRMALGAEGYGVYCMLLQLLRSEKDGEMQRNYALIGYALHLDAQLVQRVVEEFDLFSLNDEVGTFSSPLLSTMLGWTAQEAANLMPQTAADEDAQDNEAQDVVGELSVNVRSDFYDVEQSADNQPNASSSPARTRITNKRTNEQTNELPTLFSDENSVGEAAPTPLVEKKGEGKSLRRGVTRVKAVRLNPPTVEEVAAYAQSKGYEAFDAEHFVDYHTEKGWQTVHGDMVSWQSAVRTWHRNDLRYAAQQAELRAERQQRQDRIDAERRAREEARDAEFRRQSEEKHRAWMMKNADANEKSRLFHEQRDREIAQMVQEAIYGPEENYDDLPF